MKELTFGSDVPSIDLGGIVDSMSWSQAFRRHGYSFMEHVANKGRADVGYGYLFERAKEGKGKGKSGWRLLRKSRASQKMEWVDAQVKKYLTKERQFLRKLMVCMHITGEQFESSLHRSRELIVYRWPARSWARTRIHKNWQ
jgi:hypothetical protein